MPGREMGPYLLIVKRMRGKTKEVFPSGTKAVLGPWVFCPHLDVPWFSDHSTRMISLFLSYSVLSLKCFFRLVLWLGTSLPPLFNSILLAVK